MGASVEVKIKNATTAVATVADDELDNLIHQGLVTYHDALAALKAKGIALDKRFYPWLRDVENLATGEFNSKNAPKPAEAKPELLVEKPAAKPETNKDNDSKGAV